MSKFYGDFDPASTASTTVVTLTTTARGIVEAVAQNFFPFESTAANLASGDGVFTSVGAFSYSSAVGTPYGAGTALRVEGGSIMTITSAGAVQMMEFSSAFTFEFWAYRSSGANSNYMQIIDSRSDGNNPGNCFLVYFYTGTGKLSVSPGASGAAGQVIASTGGALNVWQHYAIARDSSMQMRMFYDGVKKFDASYTIVSDNKATGGAPHFFKNVNNNSPFTGYIRDLRIFKDVCIYTTAFPVTTQPLQATSNNIGISTATTVNTRSHSHVWNYPDVYDARFADTWPSSSVFHPSSPSLVSLYIPGDTDLVDASVHGHTLIGQSGAAVSSAESVFGGASVYYNSSYTDVEVSTSPSTSTSLVFGTGDFTLEYFIKTNSTNINVMHPRNESNTGTGYWAHIIQDSKLRWNHQYNVANLWEVNASADLFDNAFHHVAIVKNSGTFKVFIDGVSKSASSGTFSDSSNYIYSSAYQIAGHGNLSGGGYMAGYIDDFRVTKHAVYTTAFTVPTTALGIQTFL
tara:strand:+ start:1562 stop:3112 length:1551 start_codon:yes stop_codon:yes gene_type:complete